jgi:hypothetical protein
MTIKGPPTLAGDTPVLNSEVAVAVQRRCPKCDKTWSLHTVEVWELDIKLKADTNMKLVVACPPRTK